MNGKAKRNVVSYLGFVAWLVYGLLGKQEYWKAAACSGFLIMLVIVVYELRTRSLKIIDCTSLGCFVVAIIALVTVGEGYFIRYEVIGGWGLFAVVAWATMIAGVPFRRQYAQERDPRKLWNKALFRQIHFHLSVAWASIFTLDTILGGLALGAGHRWLLVVVIPAASMVVGFAFTVLYPAYYRHELTTE